MSVFIIFLLAHGSGFLVTALHADNHLQTSPLVQCIWGDEWCHLFISQVCLNVALQTSKEQGGRTLCFLWLKCALLIPSQKSSSTQCNQSFAAMRLWRSCERSLLSARCVILLVRGVAKKTPFYRPLVGTDAGKLQVCLLINDTSSAAVSVRDSCFILKTKRTLICFKSFKNLKPMTKHLFISQITKLIN